MTPAYGPACTRTCRGGGHVIGCPFLAMGYVAAYRLQVPRLPGRRAGRVVRCLR